MTPVVKPFLFAALGMGLLACQTPSTEAQTMRERLQTRMEERRAGGRAQQGTGQVTGGETVTLNVGGLSRSFIVAPPAGGSASSAVLMFHGGGGSAERTFSNNNLTDYADQNGFVAVYPAAVDGNWTDGRLSTAGGPDDIAFVRAIIAELGTRYGVDPSRVFATGISNGGIFTHKLACDAPGLIRAIAPVAGNMSESLKAVCNPAQGTPVMMFNGTDDPLMPYNGGRPEVDGMLRAMGRTSGEDQMVSSPDTAAFWAARNGCGAASETVLPDNANDGTTASRITYGCSGNVVELYRIEGGGHTWPGGSAEGAPRFIGTTSEEIDASATMIAFFRAYGL